jgi:metal-responsive CopG/Arc/MetJ family transcriptional regulator
MSGRPKKYSKTGRYLMTLDVNVVEEFDEVVLADGKSRSSEVNKMMEIAIAESRKKSDGE